MGGFASKSRPKALAQASAGPSPRKQEQPTPSEALAERERLLAEREADVDEREAELEEWAERLRSKDGGAGDPRSELEAVEDGGDQEGAEGAKPGPRGRRSSSLSPDRRAPRQSIFVHLAGGGVSAAELDRSVPAAQVSAASTQANEVLALAAVERRAVRVFVCSSLQGADSHARLTSQVYTRLINDANARGVGLAFVESHSCWISISE